MFRQVATVALVVMLALSGLAVATAVEVRESGSKAKSLPKELTVDLGKGVKLELVLIPAGEFLMGSPDSGKTAFTGRSRSTEFGSPSRSTWASIWLRRSSGKR